MRKYDMSDRLRGSRGRWLVRRRAVWRPRRLGVAGPRAGTASD